MDDISLEYTTQIMAARHYGHRGKVKEPLDRHFIGVHGLEQEGNLGHVYAGLQLGDYWQWETSVNTGRRARMQAEIR